MEAPGGADRVGEDEREVQPLADGQRRVLRVIQQFHDAYDEYPTVRFIARRLSLHHETVREHLAACRRKGWLRSATPAGLWCRLS